MQTLSDYRSYLKSEHWLQRRKFYLSGKPYCERCGIHRHDARVAYGQDLHVHHRNYQHVGCELDSDLEALCRRCHEIESNGRTELFRFGMSVMEQLLLESLITVEVGSKRFSEERLFL